MTGMAPCLQICLHFSNWIIINATVYVSVKVIECIFYIFLFCGSVYESILLKLGTQILCPGPKKIYEFLTDYPNCRLP